MSKLSRRRFLQMLLAAGAGKGLLGRQLGEAEELDGGWHRIQLEYDKDTQFVVGIPEEVACVCLTCDAAIDDLPDIGFTLRPFWDMDEEGCNAIQA